MMTNEHIEKLRQIVLHGGGLWVGCQEDSEDTFILFQAPLSKEFLLLPDDEFFTSNAVHEKVHFADRAFHILGEN